MREILQKMQDSSTTVKNICLAYIYIEKEAAQWKAKTRSVCLLQ